MFLTGLKLINQLLTVGVAITAFSLLLYAMTFNLRDRVARSFAFILACMTVVFVGDSMAGITTTPPLLEFWLRFEWVGLIFMPAAYLYSSHALLATTGQPAGVFRKWLIRVVFLLSLFFLISLPVGWLVGGLTSDRAPAPYLESTPLTWFFMAFYLGMMIWSWSNYWRAFRRTTTSTSRRRMLYLMAGATAPAMGSFPYLLFGYQVAANHPLIFWLAAIVSNLMTAVLVVLMAYAVAFFGVVWPDRVVRSRLIKWLARGPGVTFVVLATTTVTRQIGKKFGFSYAALEIIVMLATILIMQYLITLASPWFERWLFRDSDYAILSSLRDLETRLLTSNDLRQFLEAVLAAACDQLQTSDGFIATLAPQGLEMIVTTGEALEERQLPQDINQAVSRNGKHLDIFRCGDYWLIPLYSSLNVDEAFPEGVPHLLGIMGLADSHVRAKEPAAEITLTPGQADEQYRSLLLLAQRAAIALEDQYTQEKLLGEILDLAPQVDLIQRLRAASRYDGSSILAAEDVPMQAETLSRWVKDALTHYWGGPKLTQSPLMKLEIVQRIIQRGENPANALRNILREAIDAVRPPGERHFTGEWILYNILEMKFMEGHKVRDIARRLAVSEADFYRKQRAAIMSVADAILKMEKQAREEAEVEAVHGR